MRVTFAHQYLSGSFVVEGKTFDTVEEVAEAYEGVADWLIVEFVHAVGFYRAVDGGFELVPTVNA